MKKLIAITIFAASTPAFADLIVPMFSVDAKGAQESIGNIAVSTSEYGVVFTPSLRGLVPGIHGFHLHQNPSCHAAKKVSKMVPGLAAGGHYDPSNTQTHDAPWGKGHLGDLPPLYVMNDGSASQPVLAPRLRMNDVKGRALMIHAGGDNHSDTPKPLGGGGARVGCGTVSQ